MRDLMELAGGLDVPRFELRKPAPGLRHDAHERIIPHRFPIKGGLTAAEVMWRNVSAGNALLSRMLERRRVR